MGVLSAVTNAENSEKMSKRSSRWPDPNAERRWTRAFTRQMQQQQQLQQNVHVLVNLPGEVVQPADIDSASDGEPGYPSGPGSSSAQATVDNSDRTEPSLNVAGTCQVSVDLDPDLSLTDDSVNADVASDVLVGLPTSVPPDQETEDPAAAQNDPTGSVDHPHAVDVEPPDYITANADADSDAASGVLAYSASVQENLPASVPPDQDTGGISDADQSEALDDRVSFADRPHNVEPWYSDNVASDAQSNSDVVSDVMDLPASVTTGQETKDSAAQTNLASFVDHRHDVDVTLPDHFDNDTQFEGQSNAGHSEPIDDVVQHISNPAYNLPDTADVNAPGCHVANLNSVDNTDVPPTSTFGSEDGTPIDPPEPNKR